MTATPPTTPPTMGPTGVDDFPLPESSLGLVVGSGVFEVSGLVDEGLGELLVSGAGTRVEGSVVVTSSFEKVLLGSSWPS